MTREEAIELLYVEKSTIIEVDGNKGAEKMLQAYDMAIDALSADVVSQINYTPKPCENAICDCVAVVRCRDCKWEFVCQQTVEQANADDVEHRPLEWCSYGELAE